MRTTAVAAIRVYLAILGDRRNSALDISENIRLYEPGKATAEAAGPLSCAQQSRKVERHHF
jgi:hypothetical protein